MMLLPFIHFPLTHAYIPQCSELEKFFYRQAGLLKNFCNKIASKITRMHRDLRLSACNGISEFNMTIF